jgi:hypothetical protein
MPRYTGGCLCRAVRIEIDAPAYRAGICHCLDCRKRQGAVLHTFAVFPASSVTVTGETREYASKSFCPICGSPLFDRFGDEFELHTGCLDSIDQIEPTYECWTIRRVAWLPAFPGIVNHYERDRESPGRSDP